MVGGQVSRRNSDVKRSREGSKRTITINRAQYDKLTAKAEALTCPRSMVIEYIIETFIDKVPDLWGRIK